MPKFVLNRGNPPLTFDSLSPFARGYVEALFFTESCSDFDSSEWDTPEAQEDIAEGRVGGCFPNDATVNDLSPAALASIVEDCAEFESKAAENLRQAYARDYEPEQAGRDFWFTRNGHGVGFWDRDELDADGLGERLSKIAKRLGEVNPFWQDSKIGID